MFDLVSLQVLGHNNASHKSTDGVLSVKPFKDSLSPTSLVTLTYNA